MTDKDFKFLQELYRTAYTLKKEIDSHEETISSKGMDHWVDLRRQYDELDVVDLLVEITTGNPKGLYAKIERIRNLVLLKTNNMVRLDDKTITLIIEKAVL